VFISSFPFLKASASLYVGVSPKAYNFSVLGVKLAGMICPCEFFIAKPVLVFIGYLLAIRLDFIPSKGVEGQRLLILGRTTLVPPGVSSKSRLLFDKTGVYDAF